MSERHNKKQGQPEQEPEAIDNGPKPVPGADPNDPETKPDVYAIGDDALAEELTRLQAAKDELMQTLVRRQADFENYRKRVERERQEEASRGVGRVLEELIPVLDGFELALRAHGDPAYEEHRKGIVLIYKQLQDTLTRLGLERIDARGKQFDPNFHQAIERVETRDVPDGAVADVLQDGFMFKGRVLRPSIVRVAAHPADADEHPSARHRAN